MGSHWFLMEAIMATRELTLNIPESLTVYGPKGEDIIVSTETWSAEWILENALHGLKQRRSDKLSVTKDRGKLKELDEKIHKGEDLSGGGGPGASLSAEDKALRDCLSAKSKRLKGETLGAHLERITRELAKAQGRDFDEEMTEKVRAHLEASDLYKAKVREYRKPKAKAQVDLGDLEL